MPPKTVRDRVGAVERTLAAARDFLEASGINEVAEHRGKILSQREDIDRASQFQAVLKQRFARDLRLLDPDIAL
jgi:hypothetical protein